MKQHRLRMQARKFQKKKAREERNRVARHEAALPPISWTLEALVGDQWLHRLHLRTTRSAMEAQTGAESHFRDGGVKAVRIVERKTGNVVWTRERPAPTPPPSPADGVQSHSTTVPGVEAPA